MGYARTRLEEATERVKALEANLEVAESEKKDWCSIADNLEKRLDLVKAKLEVAVKKNGQLKRACLDVIALLELTHSPIAVERAVGCLSALVKEGK